MQHSIKLAAMTIRKFNFPEWYSDKGTLSSGVRTTGWKTCTRKVLRYRLACLQGHGGKTEALRIKDAREMGREGNGWTVNDCVLAIIL